MSSLLDPPFTVRDASTSDLAAIVSFQLIMAKETEGIELDAERVTKGVDHLLRHSDSGRYFLATSGDAVIGCMGMTYEWSDWRAGNFWWIQSVFVAAEWRRRGVFKAMFEWVRRLSESDPHCCGLRLYVEEENAKAQRTYASVGMGRAPYSMFEIDYVIERGAEEA